MISLALIEDEGLNMIGVKAYRLMACGFLASYGVGIHLQKLEKYKLKFLLRYNFYEIIFFKNNSKLESFINNGKHKQIKKSLCSK